MRRLYILCPRVIERCRGFGRLSSDKRKQMEEEYRSLFWCGLAKVVKGGTGYSSGARVSMKISRDYYLCATLNTSYLLQHLAQILELVNYKPGLY